jgi:glyoxylase-like metal-dependent hydrolase (beta-lactamase superfamily II)
MVMKYTTIVPLEASSGDLKSYYNTVVIRYNGGLVLVDAGNPGFLPKLEDTMSKAGLNPSDIKKVIITHHDGDHIGALKALTDKYPGIEVMATAGQAPYITGEQKPLRFQLAEKRYAAAASDEEKKALEESMRRLKAIETIDQVTVVTDGQVLPECGIEIVEVSGHMPGHLCVYVKEDRALITGDALTAAGGKLCPPSKVYTLDMPTALKSLEKLLAYDIENVICYHGGLITGNIGESLKDIIASGKER